MNYFLPLTQHSKIFKIDGTIKMHKGYSLKGDKNLLDNLK